jgi:NAD(P)-dependent dehydrogenase (short-subunit alcohol dehydrogenase family)
MEGNHYAIYPSLRGRTVFVTGGASGIGEAIVRRFAAAGSKVGFVDIAAEPGRTLEADLKLAQTEAAFHCCDVTDVRALQAAVRKTSEALGPISVLVNNAGHDDRHDWQCVTPEYWDGRIAVNLRHMFFAAQAAAPDMISLGSGSIINLGSITWMLGQGGMVGYSAAKAAVHGMTRSLARDLGKHGIRVNTVSPGWVLTQRQMEKWLSPEADAARQSGQALKGWVMPDDVARLVLFLAADDSAMITSQNYIVDGGWV